MGGVYVAGAIYFHNLQKITVRLSLADDPRDRVLTSDAGDLTRLAAAAANGCVIVGC